MTVLDQGDIGPRSYAWNYFALHAGQRISIFQFFISLATAIVGGAVLIAGSTSDRKWSTILFLLLPFLSFIFYRLDKRTSGLIKNAEDALKALERASATEGGSPLALFINDEERTRRAVSGFASGHMSYSRSFTYVFIATALLGIVGASITYFSPETKGNRTEDSTPALSAKSQTSNACPSTSRIDLPQGMPFTLKAGQSALGTTAAGQGDKEDGR